MKKLYKLTETQLHNIVKETVQKVLKENYNEYDEKITLPNFINGKGLELLKLKGCIFTIELFKNENDERPIYVRIFSNEDDAWNFVEKTDNMNFGYGEIVSYYDYDDNTNTVNCDTCGFTEEGEWFD